MHCKKEFQFIVFIFLISELASANENQTESSSNFIPCREGWFFFGEKCYRIFEDEGGVKWYEATDICKIWGGHLVTIENKEVQDFLTVFLLLNAKKSVWIGLHDRRQEFAFMWDDDSAVSYTNWEPGEPSGRGTRNNVEDCVEMRFQSKGKTGMWNDKDCDTRLSFICQSNKNENKGNPDPRFCSKENGGGWRYLNSCYHIVLKEKSWDDSEKHCQENYKGHLLKVLDSKSDLFLNYVLSNYRKDFWIGIKINEQKLQKWSSGWHVTYTKWSSQPVDFINGTCSLRSKEGFWTHAPCFQSHPFICETSSVKYPSLEKSSEDWTCPNSSSDWIDLGGDTCYIFEKRNLLKWYEASYVCRRKGGALVIIQSEKESLALHPHVVEANDKMLIGLHRNPWNEDVFEWIDGTEIEYQNWYPGEPNNINEKCGELLTETMLWNDVPCNIARQYICSAKKIPPVAITKKETPVKSEQIDQNHEQTDQSHEQTDQSQEQTTCPGDTSLKTVFIVLLSMAFILFLVGLVIYHLKTYCTGVNETKLLKRVSLSTIF